MKKSTLAIGFGLTVLGFVGVNKVKKWVKDAKEFQEEMIEVGTKLAEEAMQEELAKEQERQDLKNKVKELEEKLHKYEREESSEELVDFINNERAKAKRDKAISNLDDGFEID